MTKEEFEKRIKVLENQKNAIEQEIIESRNAYIAYKSLQVEDVCVDRRGKRCVAEDFCSLEYPPFISAIVSYKNEEDVPYSGTGPNRFLVNCDKLTKVKIKEE